MELLLHWMRNWHIDDNMIWKKSAQNQACFLRDVICEHLLKTHAFVVSTHRSKSITLPVYAFTMRNGIKIICRENFYGWMLSVELPQDKPHKDIIPKDVIECGYMNDMSNCYFEGFKDEWVYEGYNPDDLTQRKFSFGIRSDYDFYMAMYMLKHLYPEIDNTDYINTLTKEFISKEISKIYDKYGYNEIEIENNYKHHMMSGWEILMWTYHQLNDYDFCKKNNIDDYVCMDVVDDTDKFAEEIMKYPERKDVFVTEMKMYNAEF